jgi:hypothetical protein
VNKNILLLHVLFILKIKYRNITNFFSMLLTVWMQHRMPYEHTLFLTHLYHQANFVCFCFFFSTFTIGRNGSDVYVKNIYLQRIRKVIMIHLTFTHIEISEDKVNVYCYIIEYKWKCNKLKYAKAIYNKGWRIKGHIQTVMIA